MSLRDSFLGAACALSLATLLASPALATDFDGLLGVDYSHADADHGGSANLYGIDGSGMFGLGSNFAAQVDGGYHNEDVSHGGSVDNYNVDGTLFWRGGFGRIGAAIGYDSVDGDHTSGHVTNYGGFVDWYASPGFTLSAKGGGYDGSDHSDGDYFGAQAVGYVTPDLALTGSYDYTHLNHFGSENDWSARVEWLFSETTPVSVYGQYTNSGFSNHGGNENIYTIGLKFYFDPTGGASLVERQREGVEQYGNSFSPTLLAVGGSSEEAR